MILIEINLSFSTKQYGTVRTMAFKFVLLAAIVAVSQALVLPNGQVITSGPVVHSPLGLKVASPVIAKVATDDYDPNPQYSYSYDVNDAITGDSKSQHETRSGDVVQGSYSLVEPDGTRRTVEYTADPIQGFNAVVHREPLGVVSKVVAAPAIAKIASPYGVVGHAGLLHGGVVGHPGLVHGGVVAHPGLVHGGVVAHPGLVHGGVVGHQSLVHGGVVSSSVYGPRVLAPSVYGPRIAYH